MRWIGGVALAVALLGIAPARPAGADEERLFKAMQGIVPGFPLVGQAQNLDHRAGGGNYSVAGLITPVGYPAADQAPPRMTFSVKWAFAEIGWKRRSMAELDRLWQEGKSGGMPPGGEDGALGSHTWRHVNVLAGANDPGPNADPYMGYAQGYGMTECGNVWVQVGVGISPHGSHGARNRPDVMDSLRRGVTEHLNNVFGQILAVMRFGCSGETPPEQPADTIQAEPSCAKVVLVRGRLPSVECGIYVNHWPSARSVVTCFPTVMDGWGLLPKGIIATFTNEFFHVGAVVARGRTADEYYLPIWWYARCQAEPGLHTVTVYVQEGTAAPAMGGCPDEPNRAAVHFTIQVLEETSPNCTVPPPRPSSGGAGGGQASPGGGAGGGGTGGGAGPTGPGGGPSILGRWKTNFGDLVLTDAGNGTARGTLGTGGAVVIGKVKDGEFVGTFTDPEGDGLIHLVTPDGANTGGEWKRARGPKAGTAGRLSGTRDPNAPGTTPGTTGTPPSDLPGGGPPDAIGEPREPGGPGTSDRPPQRPIPAPLTGLTLQAPELRVTPGQEVAVAIWLLNADDVTNMNWQLDFDPAVAQASTAAGSVGKGNLLAEAFEANPAQPGRARMGFAQKKGIHGTGTVSIHRMKIVGAVGTRTPLQVSVSTITDSRPRPLAITTLDGWIEVVAPGSGTPGSTGGQPPTLQDAYNALKMSVGLMPENLALDMDRDGKVTSLDAWLIMTTVFLTMKAPK